MQIILWNVSRRLNSQRACEVVNAHVKQPGNFRSAAPYEVSERSNKERGTTKEFAGYSASAQVNKMDQWAAVVLLLLCAAGVHGCKLPIYSHLLLLLVTSKLYNSQLAIYIQYIYLELQTSSNALLICELFIVLQVNSLMILAQTLVCSGVLFHLCTCRDAG